ncbi:MAG: DUF2334 domain-containing protein [Gammaproteobacteria bacterium]|nr:DUF2334 domain-containing protein [Gammaproteobacteria bacterium]
MKVAIRDDDISYFTTPAELEQAWTNISFPITCAVTPFMVESEKHILPNREFAFHQTGTIEHPIRGNDELVAYLQEKITSGQISLALHGCNHQYRIQDKMLIAEYSDNDLDNLKRKTNRAKLEIDNLFEQTVDVFVPPDNAISAEGLKAIASVGLKYVQRAFPLKNIDTQLSLSWLHHYSNRFYFKVRYNIVYSKSFNNGMVVESAGYLFKDSIPLEKMIRDFDIFYEFDLPFTIATHYWELKNESTKNKLLNLLDYINRKSNVKFVTLREMFE